MYLPDEVRTILLENSIEIEEETSTLPLVKVKGSNCQMRIGKLLSKYIKNSSKVKELVRQTLAINASIESYTIQYITEADDYVEAYQTSLYAINSNSISCMTNSKSVQVYAYDERLALLVIYNSDEEIVGRTLVRNDTMTYVRIYLDNVKISEAQFLQILLTEGYKVLGNLDGICLALVTNNNGDILCPYLDGYVSNITVENTYLRINKYGEYDATASINGLLQITSCDYCGCHLTEDDNLYTDNGRYCESCFDENYMHFEGEVYSRDDCIITVDYEVVPLYWAERNLIFCDDNEEWYPEGDDRIVLVEDGWYLLENCVKLVIPTEDYNYAREEAAIYVKELPLFNANFVEGWYLQEQIDEIIENYLENEDEI